MSFFFVNGSQKCIPNFNYHGWKITSNKMLEKEVSKAVLKINNMPIINLVSFKYYRTNLLLSIGCSMSLVENYDNIEKRDK